jgi:transposase
MSQSNISKETKRPIATVKRWIKKYKTKGKVERKGGSGRPRITSERTDRRIAREVCADRFVTVEQIKKNLGLEDVSDDTIERRIHETTGFSSLPCMLSTSRS